MLLSQKFFLRKNLELLFKVFDIVYLQVETRQGGPKTCEDP